MRYNVITYLVGEGIRNVLKNKKSSIASLSIMICTMFMFGIFYVLGENINHIMETIQKDQQIQAFIVNEATNEEIEEVRRQIASIDGVTETRIVTREEALESMKKILADEPELYAEYEEQNIFPPSVLITLADLTRSAEIQEKVNQIKIDDEKFVTDITSSDKTINKLIKIANFIRLITAVILILLIAISTFIISNTIKLTVNARRKEISIMKYVGATNSFIRWPFIVEGIVIGILSGLFTLLLMAGLYQLIAPSVNGILAGVTSRGLALLPLKDMILKILTVYMILGVGIGVVGSSISMRKYLEV